MRTETPQPVRLADYTPYPFAVESTDLAFNLDPQATQVRSTLRLRRTGAADAPLVLNGENLELVSLHLDGAPLGNNSYTLDDKTLTLPALPDACELVIETRMAPQDNRALSGLYMSGGRYCTQCEAEGFRRITYFPDRPDVMSRFSTRIEAPKEGFPTLLSNGNLLERGDLPGGRHFARWQDPFKKPAYLFALIAGGFDMIEDQFTTMSGRTIPLRIYVDPGDAPRAHYAMDALKRAMKWDEDVFGREYDLDLFMIVAVRDFNFGAMENKGLNIFNSSVLLADPQTATDSDFERIESVVAHEYFHNWTGNRITCRDWFQLCLKEGLTVYRDQEFSSDIRSRAVQRIADVRRLKSSQFPEDAGPLAHPVRPNSYIEINNFYTTTIYEKGAELVRMIATILGEKGFKAGMDLYFERHDGDATTIENFLQCFEDANDADLEQFHLWYEQIGTPTLTCKLKHDARTKIATLEVSQIQKSPTGKSSQKPLHIPLRLGLLDKSGKDIPLSMENGDKIKDGVLHITKATQTFRFKNVTSRPTPSLLRGFSAPVNLKLDQSDSDLAFLISNDSDPFNQWQAANTYATRTIIQLVKAREKNKNSSRGTGFTRALQKALANEKLEDAFKAELLKLPSPADIAREIGKNVDYTHICQAHRKVSKTIARNLGRDLEKLYATLASRSRFSPNAGPAGRRALRNASLTHLITRQTQADFERAMKHFQSASNMTDEATALFLLAANETPYRQQALEEFYDRWHEDHIVIDSWFAAQAQSPRPQTLDEVKALTDHPSFSLTTPNKVRALIGNFVMANPLQFNRPDGAGYAFLADQILKIDPFNPQIAARLLNALRSWRNLEPKRRTKAKRALIRISEEPGISRDVFEIINKTLGR